jgi:hypothetical protein
MRSILGAVPGAVNFRIMENGILRSDEAMRIGPVALFGSIDDAFPAN